MRLIAKTDKNHSEFIDGLRKLGIKVFSLHQMGKGFPDLLVAYKRLFFLIEIKSGNANTASKKLTLAQSKFFEQFADYPLILATTAYDAYTEMNDFLKRKKYEKIIC